MRKSIESMEVSGWKKNTEQYHDGFYIALRVSFLVGEMFALPMENTSDLWGLHDSLWECGHSQPFANWKNPGVSRVANHLQNQWAMASRAMLVHVRGGLSFGPIRWWVLDGCMLGLFLMGEYIGMGRVG